MSKNDLSLFRQFAKSDGETKNVQVKNSVIYTRVSSKEQADNNNSLPTQMRRCTEYCDRKGYNHIGDFGGTYESAKSDERKEFQRMMSFVKKSKRRVHVIVVYNFDRFSRSGANAIYIASELNKRGIAIESVTQPTEAFTPGGELQRNIYFSFSQYDNSTRRQRMIDGVREALEAGKWPTQPPFGYSTITKDGQRSIIINEQGKLVKKAFKWKLQGKMENTEIVKKLRALGCPMYPQKLKKIFQNPFYCGLMAHRALEGRVVKGNHPPMISQSNFLKLNGKLNYSQNRGKVAGKEYPNTPLRNLIYCEKCGRLLTAYSRTKKSKKLKTEKRIAEYQYATPYHYYKCPTAGCKVNINAKGMHEEFINLLGSLKLDEDLIPFAREAALETYHEINKGSLEEIAELKKRLKAVDAEIDDLDERLYKKEIPLKIYDKYNSQFEEEKFLILDQLEKSSQKISNPQDYIERSIEIASNMHELWEKHPYRDQQRLQKLVFPRGLQFSGQNRKFRTPAPNRVIDQYAQLTKKTGQKKKGFTDVESGKSPSAEAEGFEPPVRVNGLRFSRPTHSTTLPNLRCKFTRIVKISMALDRKILKFLRNSSKILFQAPE